MEDRKLPEFDIEKLLDFRPPRFRCYHCRALIPNLLWAPYDHDLKCEISTCPECKVEYHLSQTEDEDGRISATDFLRQEECSIEFADLHGHARELALIARNFNTKSKDFGGYTISYTPFKALLHALTLVRRFVHFTSFGFSPFMLGIMAAAAQRVSVNGVISIISSSAANTITLANNYQESIGHRLELRVVGGEQSNIRLPHQKLVVIDGLLAFKGSANLTDFAWTNAEEHLEMVEVVTEVSAITKLNNEYFSPAWLRSTPNGHPPTYHMGSTRFDFSHDMVTIEGINADPGWHPEREFDLPQQT